MRKIIVQPTPKTPKIVYDPDSYTFVLEGRSIPEDSVGFYRKLYGWVEECGPQLTGSVDFDFRLEYFNTSTSKCLLDLFKMLQTHVHSHNPQARIRWYCSEDDPDMAETGEDYAEMLDMKFEIIIEEA